MPDSTLIYHDSREEAAEAIRQAAVRQQQQREEAISNQQESLGRWREAAGLLDAVVREWEAQVDSLPSTTRLAQRYAGMPPEQKHITHAAWKFVTSSATADEQGARTEEVPYTILTAIEQARAREHLYNMIQRAREALRKAGVG